jgi:phenylacetate-CoA ligase
MLATPWRKLTGNVVIATRLLERGRVPFLPRPELEALRDRRIRDVVAYAARVVPYYREWFAREGVDPRGITGAADLDRLPVLDRELVRAEPRRFVAETRAARDAVSFATSGTTGRPLRVFHDRRSLLGNFAWGERERAPVNRICGGAFRPKELYVGYETSTFKTVQAFYEANTLLPVRPRRRFVPLQEPLDRVVTLLNGERPDVLVGYGGWIDLFFKTIAARGAAVHLPRAVMSMGEALPHGTREFIEERLGVPVLSRYNAVEAFKIGFSCEERTGFHLHEDLCHVRVLGRDGTTLPPGTFGAIVLSNLMNRATVLLNYPIGDVGTMASGPCACGRTFARLAELEGRVEDVIATADGRFVHPRAVWQLLKDDADLLQYQLVQHGPQRFRLTLVTLDEAAFQRVQSRALPGLQRLLGAGAVIETTRRSEMERGPGGKFRAVSSFAAASSPA